MNRTAEQIITSTTESDEPMTLYEFKTCVAKIREFIKLSAELKDICPMKSKRCYIKASNLIDQLASCFSDERENLESWIVGDECSFKHPITKNEVSMKIRDDEEAIYCFLRYCEMLQLKEELDEDFCNYLAYILCDPVEE